MLIEEAIRHCEERSQCKDACGEEHAQLAGWLKRLVEAEKRAERAEQWAALWKRCAKKLNDDFVGFGHLWNHKCKILQMRLEKTEIARNEWEKAFICAREVKGGE